jgi:hypothetical protein
VNAYQALLYALESGKPSKFEAVPLSGDAERYLANPQACYAYEMTGGDGHSCRIAAPPTFAGARMAAEMGEVYWQALTRDVPFRYYDSDPIVGAAVNDLNVFSKTVGPKIEGKVTPDALFRGETKGDLIGPYISQFLWLPVQYGPAEIKQMYPLPKAREDFMTNYREWLNIQRGAQPQKEITFGRPRYIYNNRALGQYVHVDMTFQAYFNAALIMLGFGPDALADSNPYKNSKNQGGFVTFGASDIVDLVAKAANVGLKAAWFQKWHVHRRLRPEVFAARIENQSKDVKEYGINSEVLDCDAVDHLFTSNGNRLLPLAYPEGSPTHPAYPAGHACAAGACATILKAFFKENFEIPHPVQASADGRTLDSWTGDPLTLGGEINKLASNISIGRDAAGVHYRSDGIQGMKAGEQVGIGILCDYSRTYNEDFDGFVLTRLNGQRIRIRNGKTMPK